MKDIEKTYTRQEVFRVKNSSLSNYEKENYDISQIGTLYNAKIGAQVIRMKTCRIKPTKK